MKVLIVMNSSNVTYGGGIVQVILNYCVHLCDRISFDYAINEKKGCNLHEKFFGIGERFFCLPNKKKSILGYIKALYKICKKGQYDVIHVHGNSANMLIELQIAQFCGIKRRVAHCHNSRCSHPILNAIISPVFRRSYTSAVACSESAGNWVFGKENFTVLRNAIDLDKYKYSECDRNIYRRKLGIDKSTLVVGHIGSINEQKNHEWLLEIFAKIVLKNKDALLVLIGDGPLRNKIEEQAKLLGLKNKVCFLGIQNNAEKWLQVMDVFVFPSKWEGLGMAAIEAQASGLAVVASTEVPSDAKILDKFYYMSLDASSEEWANLVLELHLMYNDRSINKKLFIHYDISHEYKQLMKIYENKGR